MTLDASVMNVSPETTGPRALDAYGDARLAVLRSALAILSVLSILALFLAQSIPTRPAGATEKE